MKRFVFGAVAAFLAAALCVPCSAQAVSAQKAVVLDGVTGRILFARNPDERSLIASTTKIMTALVVCEQCNVLDRVRIPAQAVGIEGSSMYLQAGEVLTVQELLYGMMLHSGNDAAAALAIYCGGTLEGFAELMNDKARVLGLKNTHFVNPHGLDAPEHYSTAKDLALLTSYAMQNPIFSMTVSARTVRIGQRHLTNHNKLLWRLDGANGVKTGYTKAAGRILVSGACRDGRQLICVTINAPDDWNDHTALLEDAFTRFSPRTLVKEGDCLGVVELAGGEKVRVPLLAAESFDYAMAEGEEVRLRLPGSGFAYAPVERGQSAGIAHIFVDDCCVGAVEMVYGETAEQLQPQKKSFWQRMFGG